MKTRIFPWQLSLCLRAWLSPAESPRRADLIFVLAGRMERKHYALELFRQGLAPRLLLSVSRFEIRRFSKMNLPVSLDLLKLAQSVPPAKRHYFVDFQGDVVRADHVLPGRFGTLTEIDALARSLAANPQIRSVLVISSDTHLRRVRLCCQSLLSPGVEVFFLATPSLLPGPAEESREVSAREDLVELLKLWIYWILLKFRRRAAA